MNDIGTLSPRNSQAGRTGVSRFWPNIERFVSVVGHLRALAKPRRIDDIRADHTSEEPVYTALAFFRIADHMSGCLTRTNAVRLAKLRSMETKEILQKLEPWREKHRRPAWKPIVEDGDGPTTSSKFAGVPWLSSGESVPKCATCGRSLRLFLQLDLDTLPNASNGRFGKGLLQLFYCANDKCDGEGWRPFSNQQSLVRVVQPNGPGMKRDMSGASDEFPAKRIVGWEEFQDWPHSAEQEELGLRYTYDFKANTVHLEYSELGLLFQNVQDDELAEKVSSAQAGDKLGGWPYWVQGVEYPNCPRCNRRMVLIFQLDSEDNLQFMFGDSGCGHITQCSEHKDVVAFGWACC